MSLTKCTSTKHVSLLLTVGVAPDAHGVGYIRGWLCGVWRARGGTRRRVVGFEKNEITDWVAASWPCSNQSLVGCDRECIMYTIQPPYIRGIALSLHTPCISFKIIFQRVRSREARMQFHEDGKRSFRATPDRSEIGNESIPISWRAVLGRRV